MSETKSSSNYSIIAYESGAKKLGENIANRALDFVVEKAKKQFNQAKIIIGVTFIRYLNNAFNRINQVKTLATGNDPRNIIGDNELYVKIGVKYKDKEIDTSCVENLISESNNILIIGSGGVGKSMLSRYLFLRTVLDGNYIPVYVELRKTSQQSSGNISIIKLIEDCMEQFDVELPKDEFIYSLRLGKYLFVFDGFDEVKDEMALETADKIQSFCAKYPKNNCIITSRQTANCNPLETFIKMESLPLRKDQAIELASKIWEKDEKTVEFCNQLDSELFEKHNSFAENPLLLSMMFLTFMRNLSIPDHLADFYKKAYEALYSQHDNYDKGVYRRDFKCSNLDERQFRILFSRFCFQTYFQQKYEFEEEEILEFIKKSSIYFKYNINEKDYLADLKNAVCMVYEEGNIYKFSHRSFQAYFAAVYTSEKLTDEMQKRLFRDVLYNNEAYMYDDYFELLNQIERERFAVNALEDGLRDLQKKANESKDPDRYLLKQQTIELHFSIDKKAVKVFRVTHKSGHNNYNNNLIFIIKHIIYLSPENIFRTISAKTFFTELSDILILTPFVKKEHIGEGEIIEGWINFDDIDNSNEISAEIKQKIYNLFLGFTCGGTMLREKIYELMEKIDSERTNLTKDNYIENF